MIPLPSGLSIDSSKVTIDTTARSVVGNGVITNAVNPTTTSTAWITSISPYNSTNLCIATLNQASTALVDFRIPQFGSAMFGLGNTNLAFSFTALVPIAGWSSSVQTSDQGDSRVVAARFTRSTTQNVSTTSPTKVQLNTVSFDTHAGFNAVNNRYIAPVAGFYRINAAVYCSAITSGSFLQVYIYRNGSDIANSFGIGTSTSDVSQSVSTLVQLNAGDFIELFVSSNDSSYTAIVTGKQIGRAHV